MDLSTAESFMRAGQHLEAQKEFRRLINLHPTNARLHAYEGMCFYRMAQLEAAIPCFQRAVSLDPNFVEAGVKLAQSFDRLKRYEEAYVVVKDFLKVQPNDRTLQGLAYFLKDQTVGNRKEGWERTMYLDTKITFASDES